MPVAIAIRNYCSLPGRATASLPNLLLCYRSYGKTNQNTSSRQASQSGGPGRILRDSRRGRSREEDRRAETRRAAKAAGSRCPGGGGGSFRGWSGAASFRFEPGNLQSAERAFRQAGGGSKPPGFRASGGGTGAEGAATAA